MGLASPALLTYTMDMSRINVLDRFLDPVGSFLTPEVAKRLVGFRADAKTQARLDKLADKCREGRLSDKERAEYDTYLTAIGRATVRLLNMNAEDRLKVRAALEESGELGI